jgi:hypothetical protein
MLIFGTDIQSSQHRVPNMSILELFCSVDDFWQQFAPNRHHDLLMSGQRQRLRPIQLHPSEILTMIIWFHQSHDQTFKAYYIEYVQRHLPSRVSHMSQLFTLRRVDAHQVRPVGRLSADPTGPLAWHELHRRHLACRLPQPAHPAAPRFCQPCRTRQDLGGLVLWLQVAPGRQ